MNQELPRHATMPAPPGGADGRPSLRLGQHLRRLREGYGYTLRKVEEKALTLGEAIDNSQLSRFEKGKALPSFDKLRALAQARLQKFAEASPRILNGPRLHHQLPTCCQISLVVPRDVRKAAPGRSGASRGLERVNSQREML